MPTITDSITLDALAEGFRVAYEAADKVAQFNPERARAERYGIDLAVLSVEGRVAPANRTAFRVAAGYRSDR